MLLFSLLSGASAAEISIQLVDKKGRGVSAAYVELVAKNGTHRVSPGKGVIDQVDKEFVPLVSMVPKGSTVSFPNSDNIQHQIYSFSKAKKFDLPLFATDESKTITFDQAGIVKMGCNIHDWMLSYLYVRESQFLVNSDDKGMASFSGVPAGDYQLRIWSPRMKSNGDFVGRDVTVIDTANPLITQELKVRKKIRKKPRIEDEAY